MPTFLIQKTVLIVFLVFGNVSAWAQIQKSLVGFQDIPWGTKLTQVRAKLTSVKIIDDCLGEKSLKESANQANRSCTSLSQEYIVDGVSFVNTFIFDSTDRLKRVELLRFESSYKNPIYSDETCNKLFNQLEHLLDLRYGSSLNVSNPETRAFWVRSEYKAWLPLPTEIIIVKSFDYKNPIVLLKNPDIKSCEVIVSYSPRVSPEAKKL